MKRYLSDARSVEGGHTEIVPMALIIGEPSDSTMKSGVLNRPPVHPTWS